METKLSSINLDKGKNTWTFSLVGHPGPFLKWTKEELKQMNQTTRKLMTIHKALHLRDDMDRWYVSRREGGRGLASIEDSVDALIQRLEDYKEMHRGRQITVSRNYTDNTRATETAIARKQKLEEKQLYGRFKFLTSNISHE